MGVTLHAIIEVRSREDDSWWTIGTWELGKNSELMDALADSAKRAWPGRSVTNGWPEDSPALSDPDLEFRADEGRQWCSADVMTIVRDHVYWDVVKERDRTHSTSYLEGLRRVGMTEAGLRSIESDLIAKKWSWPYEALDPLIVACALLKGRGYEVRLLWYQM